jgi:hypothetical protein
MENTPIYIEANRIIKGQLKKKSQRNYTYFGSENITISVIVSSGSIDIKVKQ